MSDPTAIAEIVNLHATDLPEIDDRLEILPVPLTSDEWADRATVAAMLGGEIDDLRSTLKARADEVKTEIKLLQSDRDRADAAVRNRSEPRPVGVRVLADLERLEAVVVRVDTGEVVDRRPLSDVEIGKAQQQSLALR